MNDGKNCKAQELLSTQVFKKNENFGFVNMDLSVF